MRVVLALIVVAALGEAARASAADAVDWKEIFKGKDGCFILYDLKADKLAEEYGKERCAEPLSPASTFKIPIAVMAFDRGFLKSEESTIKWDHVDRKNPNWNRDQTPQTWFKFSTVWVTQRLVQKIGAERLQKYLADFRYGNRDMSGGLTNAWLGSTLKISADEQLEFLKRLWRGQLAASPKAVDLAKKSLDVDTAESGTILQGKTGSSFLDGRKRAGGRELGWYVGHLTRGDAEYLVVTNFSDTEKPGDLKPGGERAKAVVQDVLGRLGLY
jgi:beta-lactamase class D